MREITINQINQGGIADSKYMGESNSVAVSVGLDLHSTPGVIQSNYQLSKESGTTIDEFCKVIVPTSEGNTYFFSSESGKIWVRNSSGIYSLKYTTIPTAGDPECLGATEYDGYIYWATARYLYRVPVNSSGWGSLQTAWSSTIGYDSTDIVAHEGVNYVATTAHDATRIITQPNIVMHSVKTHIAYDEFSRAAGSTITDTSAGSVGFTETTDDITADGAKIQEATYLVYLSDAAAVTILKGTTADETESVCPDLPAGALGKMGEILIKVAAGSTNFDAGTDELDEAHLTVTFTDTNMTTLAETEPGTTIGATYWETTLPDYAVEWATFGAQDTEYHPMIAIGNNLWIGDGHYVSHVRNNIFTANALDLPDEQRIRTLGKLDIQLAMGTFVNNYVNKSTIFRWDGWSVSWNMDDTVEELGVNAFIPIDNYFYVQVGLEGNIYAYDNNMLYLVKRVPGDYSTTNTSEVLPNATAYFKGKPLFGMSNGNGSSASGATVGIYSLATVNPRLYNRILALEYLPSTTSTTAEIGAMAAQGSNLFVSWKSGTSVGIDNIDYTMRYPTSYLESRVIRLDRAESNIYTRFVIGYVNMPANCSVQAYIKQNYASSWTELTLTPDTIRKRYYSDLRLESNTLEFKVVLNSYQDDSPVIDHISLIGEEDNGG
jgi:hypothetical protein